jgi:hypothetical protein
MHIFTISFWAVHVTTCLVLEFLRKIARNLYRKMMDRVMDALLIAPMLNLISEIERTLKVLLAASIFLACAGAGVYLGNKSLMVGRK